MIFFFPSFSPPADFKKSALKPDLKLRYNKILKGNETRVYQGIMNLLEIDARVASFFQEEKKRLVTYKRKLDELRDILSQNNLTSNEKNRVTTEINDLDAKIQDITYGKSMALYHLETEGIIKEYRESLARPVSFSFMKRKHEAPKLLSQDKYHLFQDAVRKYTPLEVSGLLPAEESFKCDCGNCTEFEQSDERVICNQCGKKEDKLSFSVSFRDTDRVNTNPKFKYVRKVHFKDRIKQCQGKENVTIPERVTLDVKRWVDGNIMSREVKTSSLNFRDMKPSGTVEVKDAGKPLSYTKDQYLQRVQPEHVKQALQETGNSKYYQHKVKIWLELTGGIPLDLSSIEDLLYEEHDILNNLYDNDPEINVLKDGRTSFLNSDYVITQLLLRHGYRYQVDDPEFLKTGDRLPFHNTIFRKMCDKLQWSFTAL